MICRIGLLVVIATCASVASALPPCVCTRELKPVCGSDGETYNNMCLLACRQETQPGLQLHSHGRCRSARQADDGCLCTLEYDPVCASDGSTYPNRCAMNCNGRNLKILHYGECRSKREVAAERICPCPFNYAPVCGTNGETYPNECTLKCVDNVRVAHAGECRTKRSDCICPLVYAPVCGTDGKTYGNACAMDCDGTGDVKMAYSGPCGVPRQVEDEPPLCFCTYEHDPVCGSNGRTYANMCALECEGDTVQVAYKGDCRAKRESVQIANLPACLCSREAMPICGTDGNTYSNPCLLNCMKEQREDLEIDHTGPCRRKAVKVREVIPEQGCSCTRDMQPVCASNGVTYNNECLMRCAGDHLTVEKYERCD